MANKGVPQLTDEQIKRLDQMCPVAADVDLGTLLDLIKAMLDDHETRIATLETP